MNVLASYLIGSKYSGIRLEEYLMEVIDVIPSKKGIQKLIKRKFVLVNDDFSSTGYRLKSGDVVQWIESNQALPAAFKLNLPIVYEDEHLAVINKPAGIPVSGNQHRTIAHALPYNLSKNEGPGNLQLPRPVHRLDSATSGLLLVAKTSAACVHLSRQFQMRSTKKEYLALVMGSIPDVNPINTSLDGKVALTSLDILETVPSLKSKSLSLVKLWPKTGRTHQIRRHLAGVGCPILGDALYGEPGHILKHKGLFLCAVRLEITHPITNEQVSFRIDPPGKFKKRMESEALRWRKFNPIK